MKPDFLKLKAKQADGEAENMADGGATKAVGAKDGAGEHAHTMLVNESREFNTGAEDHCFFLRVSDEKLVTPPPSWMLLDSEGTIYIIANKVMVSNIRKSPSPITLHCNEVSRQVDYTSDLNGYGRVWYDPKEISNILSLYCTTRKYRVISTVNLEIDSV